MKSYLLFVERPSSGARYIDSRFMQRKRFLSSCCLLHPSAAQVLQGPINAGRVRVFVVA